MIASPSDLIAVLRRYNPWWSGSRVQGLPSWRRAVYRDIRSWLDAPPGGRALLLSGARQTGKTTLFLQAIEDLLEQGVPATNILYATFDHPLLKLIGLDALLDLWRDFETRSGGEVYLFLDEIQSAKDWQVWLKHQVDFQKKRRIAVTGSATPLLSESVESGVGRWQTVRLATLSFYEYLQLRGEGVDNLPELSSLASLFDRPEGWFGQVAEDARPLTARFHEYLLRGGFPQSALIPNIALAQKLLREDIVDKVLKRDMTALFGVRRVLELEQTFLYLCLHDGGLLDVQALCSALEVKKPTVNSFIDLLEATHLVYRLRPFGYGKEVLRGKSKIYLADPAIAPAVMLRGKELLEDSTQLGQVVETAFFKHVFSRYYQQSIAFSYWRGKKDWEVDIVADIGGRLVPFEVKYRSGRVGAGDLRGLAQFCEQRGVKRGYAITRDGADFGVLSLGQDNGVSVLKIPAPLACYWLGQSEVAAG